VSALGKHGGLPLRLTSLKVIAMLTSFAVS